MKSLLTFIFLISKLTFASAPILYGEIRGSINPATASFLSDLIMEANKTQAQAIIVELDTPGGLIASVREMAQKMDESKVPVIVYTTPAGASATSAGALLMLASHIAAMSPGANIGAAHPVSGEGKNIEGAMGDKVLNDTAAFARSLAERRGRPVAVAEEFVRKSVSFTSEEAIKKGLIDVVAEKKEDLLKYLDGKKIKLSEQSTVTLTTEGAPLQIKQMSIGQKVLNILANPNVAAVLMTLAMLLIYVEISNPGITIAGILGGMCLITAFVAFQTLPIRTGGVALIGLGMIFIFIELFIPSKGMLSFGGVLSFILGLLWVIDPSQSDLKLNLHFLLPIALGLGTGVGLIGLAAARTVSLSKKALKDMKGGGLSGLLGYDGEVKSVEEGGKSGMVQIRGELWRFESSVTVQVGDFVEVTETKGLGVLVSKKS